MLTIGIIILLITTLLIIVLNITAKKSFIDREKSSPFECGFEPLSTSRMPFSIHFFLIAIIFVIFDVELVLLFPTIPSMKLSSPMMLSLTLIMFIFILLVGLYHEWNQGALNWK
uniref:NADH-ubiquinone oxidoreductase chain 3 n=1 Tax=Curculionidae sp. BMNH 1039956 TaxID=1903770 RepID=A0A343A5T0_9CUCU|nr:NADH dehydrogenase subunit 3 [Curculionidae sp. BMNH 1039956]